MIAWLFDCCCGPNNNILSNPNEDLTSEWTDGTMLIIVSVVLVLEIENVVSDRQTEMYRITCRMVRLTTQVYVMLSCCGAYFSHVDYPYFLTIPHYQQTNIEIVTSLCLSSHETLIYGQTELYG